MTDISKKQPAAAGSDPAVIQPERLHNFSDTKERGLPSKVDGLKKKYKGRHKRTNGK